MSDTYDNSARVHVDGWELDQNKFMLTANLNRVAVRVSNDPADPLYVASVVSTTTIPKITILNVTDKDTKTEFEFETGCKRYTFRCEKVITILYNFSEADFDAGKKATITSGGCLQDQNICIPAGTKIYFETSSDNRDIEIKQWV